MVAVEHIAAAAEVVIFAVRRKHIIDIVVNSLKGEERSQLVALGGVVEHNVENNLNAIGFEVANQLLELGALAVVLVTVNGFVAGIRRKKADSVVAPVIIELLALKGAVRAHFVKLKNRHQLNGVDSQLLEVGNLFADTGKGAAVLNAGALVHRKASDVKLINNQFLKRNRGRLKVAPVVVLKHHARLVDALILLRLAPAALTGDRLGVGVEDIFCLVKHQTLFGVVGTVD